MDTTLNHSFQYYSTHILIFKLKLIVLKYEKKMVPRTILSKIPLIYNKV